MQCYRPVKNIFHLSFLLLPTILLAQNDQEININGFGSIGTIYNSDNSYLFRPNIASMNGSDGNIDYKTETLLGLQANYDYNDKISVGLQGVIQPGEENDPEYKQAFRASLEWAYLKYTPISNLSFRAGRLRMPGFLYSETINVGYTYPWVRTPTEIYGQLPFNYYDGLDFSYHGTYSDYFYQLRGVYGQAGARAEVPEELDFKMYFEDIWGTSLTIGTNNLLISLNYMQGIAYLPETIYDLLFDALAQSGFNSVLDEVSFNSKKARYASIGFRYTYDQFDFIGEFSKTDTGSTLQQYDAWYLHVGYNFDNFNPYIAYAETSLIKDGITYSNPIPNDIEALAPVNMALQYTTEYADASRSTWSVGMRYEVMDNMALKLQYDHTSMDSKDGGFAIVQSPGEADGDLDVISAALHFVF